MTDQPLECHGLVKTFGQTRALDGVDLTVAPGEVLGFLGPNGAGKSTTIRGLLGQIRLDRGRATLFGHDVWRASVKAHERIAYVPGDVALWPGLSGGECIDLLGSLQGRPNARRREELIERFEFDPTKRTRTYSKGNRQKVALIAALSTDADLFMLDEPTSGLDPLMEAQFQSIVRERVEEGAAVLLSSHIMGEVEALCERISIIRAGKIVRSGSLADLRTEAASTVECTTAGPLNELVHREDVTILGEHSSNGTVHTTLRVEPGELVGVLEFIIGRDPQALTVQPPTLDELFLGHYSTNEAPRDGEEVVVSR